MNKEIKNADIEKITVDYATKVRETEEEFIFQTITPFCFNILLKIISKKELKDTLLRGQQMKWIPCSERLPKDRQIVVADIECGIEDRMCIFAYFKIVDHMECWINANTGFRVLANVVQWTPLPEPYREERHE